MLAALMLAQLWATKIAPPVPLAQGVVLASPTAAARALSVEGIAALPATPVTITLQCAVDRDTLTFCIPAADGGTADTRTFWQRALSSDRAQQREADPLLDAALTRMQYYRVQPMPARPKVTPTVLIREIVSVADRAPSGPPTGISEQRALPLTTAPFNPGDFYPASARRAGASNTIRATCRVLADLSLYCRDPQVDLPPREGPAPAWRQPEFDRNFLFATRMMLAAAHAEPVTKSGEPGVGRDVVVRIGWYIG